MKYVLPIKIDFVKSHGTYLFDKISNTDYLDFFSMYSSLPLGYNHPIFDEQFHQEIREVSYMKMANNICQSDQFLDFFEEFKKIAFSPYVHFTSTGALAVESALKAAMEYKKVSSPIVLSVEKSFHGVNSWGFATSRYGITGKRMEYFPENSWPKLSIKDLIHYLHNESLDNVVAVIIEPIQCTNGDIYLDIDDLKTIRQLCMDNNICFIFDEIQTGFGTTGKMWYYEHIGIQPDIVVFGKKAQVSGIIVSEKYKEIFDSPYQKLDVTFDGDLIDMIRCKYILKAYQHYNILENVQQNSLFLKNGLKHYFPSYRSIGHLIAFDFETQQLRDSFAEGCFKNKLLVNKASDKTIRVRPNLAYNHADTNVIPIIKDVYETL